MFNCLNEWCCISHALLLSVIMVGVLQNGTERKGSGGVKKPGSGGKSGVSQLIHCDVINTPIAYFNFNFKPKKLYMTYFCRKF